MTRGVRVGVTRIDRWVGTAALTAAAFAALLLWASQAVVAPPRPRISDTEVASVGLGLREGSQGAPTVSRVAEGAAHAGLRGGDRIVAIDELRDPSVAPKMSGLTYDPVHKPTAEFARRIKNDYEVVGKLFHDYNVKLD